MRNGEWREGVAKRNGQEEWAGGSGRWTRPRDQACLGERGQEQWIGEGELGVDVAKGSMGESGRGSREEDETENFTNFSNRYQS